LGEERAIGGARAWGPGGGWEATPENHPTPS
jgi:hypothetical protein